MQWTALCARNSSVTPRWMGAECKTASYSERNAIGCDMGSVFERRLCFPFWQIRNRLLWLNDNLYCIVFCQREGHLQNGTIVIAVACRSLCHLPPIEWRCGKCANICWWFVPGQRVHFHAAHTVSQHRRIEEVNDRPVAEVGVVGYRFLFVHWTDPATTGATVRWGDQESGQCHVNY